MAESGSLEEIVFQSIDFRHDTWACVDRDEKVQLLQY